MFLIRSYAAQPLAILPLLLATLGSCGASPEGEEVQKGPEVSIATGEALRFATVNAYDGNYSRTAAGCTESLALFAGRLVYNRNCRKGKGEPTNVRGTFGVGSDLVQEAIDENGKPISYEDYVIQFNYDDGAKAQFVPRSDGKSYLDLYLVYKSRKKPSIVNTNLVDYDKQ